jgi:hypothetical protein
VLPALSQSEIEIAACFVQDIAALLESFSEKDTTGKQSMQQMLSSDRAAFSRAAVQVLAQAADSAGVRFMVHLLRKHSLLTETLIDPRGLKQETAVVAARTISRIGTPLDADLEKVLGATLAERPSPANAARVLRLLDLLEAASAQPRFNLFQTELLGYPDSAVRLKSILLIACGSKNGALVARLLLDEDPRVQANAVEALWSFDPAEARPLLLQAARSKAPQVAGNAAVGLYRLGDLSSLRMMFTMAREPDSARRASAAWAMGETGDPRFLPVLTARFAESSGNEKMSILQALGRIRRREKALAEIGALEIRSWDAKADETGRHLVLSLWSPDHPDLSALKPTQFAIREGGSLVQDYEIVAHPNPPMAISGFILPRFSSLEDPYRVALMDGIGRCLKYKRADDLWRLDRYLLEPRASESAPIEKAALPYDDVELGAFAKLHQRGFLAAPEALRRLVESPGSKERATDNVIAAFDRQSDAMIKFSGKRRLFLFLPTDCGRNLERHLARLTAFIGSERITLHGIALKGSAGSEELGKLCLASEGGTFAELMPHQIADDVERIYAQSINRFDVTYRVPEQTAPAEGSIQITSGSGCGRASFTFQ